ncbi:MAG: iron ABC transporter substrate-binding protein [Methanobrevibacter olleyae]|uniref:Iron ABC transporter substrate-binding protein n=1 Tax=Methanobrevibacter olleyae TaxID=294671 RepID=A0A8T3VRW9_METOL|nr:iron ABC transporter substrate-binding protein [Methanobrevibacter olleyae]
MDKKIYFSIVVVVAIIVTIPFIYNNDLNENSSGIMSIEDMAGRTVNVPANVEKVVGVGCSAREIVYLNAEDKIVGIEQIESNSQGAWGNELPYMKSNENLMKLPIIGNAKTDTVDYEKISSLKPDVIFAGTPEQANLIQTKTGIPTIVTYVGSVGTEEQMEKYKKSLTMMGKVLDKEDRAKELIDYMDEIEKDLEERTNNANKDEKVYVAGQAFYGVHGITSTNPYYPSFIHVNAANVASGVGGDNATLHAIQIDKEQLLKWNPDYIFIEGASNQVIKEDISKNPDYKNISAIKNKRVYTLLTYCLYSYNKEEMYANSYYIGKILYPEEFNDVDLNKKTEEIFIKFNGDNGGNASKSIISHYNAFEETYT